MSITITLSDEDYQMLIQMLVNSNPLIQKIAVQANQQMQAREKTGEPKPEPKQPEIVKPTFDRERDRR